MVKVKKVRFLIATALIVGIFSSQAMAAELTGDDLYLPHDAKVVVLQAKDDWNVASLAGDELGMNVAEKKANDVRAQYDGIYYATDGSTYTEDDILRVAGLINHEAATNDIDRFMVGSTFVNRWHCEYWGTTTKSVLSASGQYYSETYDSKHKKFLRDAANNGWTKENNRFMYIANKCLSGEFTTPSNVYGQAAGKQGVLYMYVNNKQLSNYSGFYNHQYCTMFGGEALSGTDWAGTTALTKDEAVNRIYELATNAPA